MKSYLQNFKYELAGQEGQPKLVFLHGVMGSGANWRKITSLLQGRFQILTFDQRGHGRSFKPKSGYAPEDYALDLKLILEELGWSRVILVGHSMGGRNAIEFAHKFPEMLSALIVEDIGPQGNPVAMQKTIDLVNMVPVPFRDKNAAKEYLTHDFVEKLAGRENAKILGQYFYTNIETQADGTADWRFAKDAIMTSLTAGHFSSRWEAIRDLAMPTLFIRGETSEEFPKEEFEQVLKANSNITGVEIKGAGHWVHSDQPQEFTRVLLHFLHERLGF